MVPDDRRVGLLFGRYVITAEGATLGRIHDVRLRADGPILPGFGPAFRIEGVIIRPESIASRLGFDRPDIDGPWPLSALGKRAARRALVVPWETLNLDEHVIVTTRNRAELEPAFS
jgi:hypothetical protein